MAYERQSISNPLHIGEESSWVTQKNSEMEQRAIDLGLYDDAQSSAEALITGLLEPLLPQGCQVAFTFSQSQEGEANEG